MNLLIGNAEVAGETLDVRIAANRIVEIGPSLSPRLDEDRYDAGGGALLPGLHDHHLHLHAMAAAAMSVRCGPPDVTDLAGLAAALRAADVSGTTGEWLRGVGYHESVAGIIDRCDLDRIVPVRPVRIQHRSGGLWLLNTAGLHEIGLLSGDGLPEGVETDADDQPTGRLWRADHLFRHDADLPRLGPVGRQLLSLGITGVTDATPSLDPAALADLVAARRAGCLPQRLVALGTPDGWDDPFVMSGPRKLLLHDHDLPTLDELTELIAGAHHTGRPVAVHCVTRTSLVLTVTALEVAGTIAGDRIEHASVVPADLIPALRSLQVRVVTQPAFVHDRGDSYATAVEPDDVGCLYPYGSLLAGGIPVAPSSDAPFGAVDPWRTIAAAMTRQTTGGAVLGRQERVSAQQALAGYLSAPATPGGAVRRITIGAPADVCALSLPLAAALAVPDSRHVAMVVAGDARYDAGDPFG